MRGGVPDLNASWASLLPQLALSFPFELDTFQKEAIVHLEQGHSVREGWRWGGGGRAWRKGGQQGVCRCEAAIQWGGGG